MEAIEQSLNKEALREQIGRESEAHVVGFVVAMFEDLRKITKMHESMRVSLNYMFDHEHPRPQTPIVAFKRELKEKDQLLRTVVLFKILL